MCLYETLQLGKECLEVVHESHLFWVAEGVFTSVRDLMECMKTNASKIVPGLALDANLVGPELRAVDVRLDEWNWSWFLRVELVETKRKKEEEPETCVFCLGTHHSYPS